jgi:flotillin
MRSGIQVGGVDIGTAVTLLAVAVAAVIAAAIFVAVLRQFLYICRPNEILIYAGRKHQLPDGFDGRLQGGAHGWAVRTPLLETVSRRWTMRLFMVEVAVNKRTRRAASRWRCTRSRT